MAIGMCVLWVRSYERYRSVYWARRQEVDGQDRVVLAEASSVAGAVQFSWLKYRQWPAEPQRPLSGFYFMKTIRSGPRSERSMGDGGRASLDLGLCMHFWIRPGRISWKSLWRQRSELEKMGRRQYWIVSVGVGAALVFGGGVLRCGR